MNKIGLILEGGGMRGAYTGGVLDALMDMGIYFEDVYGVSAGAGNALSYITKQIGRNYHLYTHFISDKRYLSVSNFFKTGSLFGMKFAFYDVPQKYLYYDYEAFRNSKEKLTIVATDVKTGKPFYKTLDNAEEQMKYVCASSAIPMASTIVKIDGNKLLDGGASDSIPIEHSLKKGNTKNIIVLTRNEGFVAKKSKLAFFFHIRYIIYQKFAKKAASRYEYYNKSMQIAQSEAQKGSAIIIRPKNLLEVDRFEKDTNKLSDLYMEGYNETMAIKTELLDFIKDCDNVEISTPPIRYKYNYNLGYSIDKD